MKGPHGAEVFDWNWQEAPPVTESRSELLDETLREGLQSPSVADPPLAKKIELVHLMHDLGVSAVNIGLPAAGPRAAHDFAALAREVRDSRLPVALTCAARTTVADIRPAVEVVQQVGLPIEVYAFIGASPVRLQAENWSLEHLLERIDAAVGFARREGLAVCLVTEDTTRSRPELLERLFRTALDLGVGRLCLCDTVGHATPAGVRSLFAWTRRFLQGHQAQVALDWHGHNDRGLALGNALCAVELGASRVHGTGLGIGERVGNAPLDQLLVNLQLMGRWPHDLSALVKYCETVARACGVAIPCNYPVVGRDAFRTATGVHAAAIIKAAARAGSDLADTVYSGIAAGSFGRRQEIEIGPMSGLSNVRYWLEQHGFTVNEGLARTIFDHAKSASAVLRHDELMAIVRDYSPKDRD
jgi:2-isopropylmalate synthase